MLFIQLGAFLAQRLAACPIPAIFRLDIVPGLATRIVVMNGLFDGVPWLCLRHSVLLPR